MSVSTKEYWTRSKAAGSNLYYGIVLLRLYVTSGINFLLLIIIFIE